ncbi:hypothetical protein PLESTB_000168400 [Pleodorina starrii]|uniref:Uncharacterized protein n=1 Tax=Pleodorina starrii TaxID=330485 RepID=A0A9W6BBA2_9CHLO|nr:hypothetical protein PLESTB_000168400 [Pleodorina starrii]
MLQEVSLLPSRELLESLLLTRDEFSVLAATCQHLWTMDITGASLAGLLVAVKARGTLTVRRVRGFRAGRCYAVLDGGDTCAVSELSADLPTPLEWPALEAAAAGQILGGKWDHVTHHEVIRILIANIALWRCSSELRRHGYPLPPAPPWRTQDEQPQPQQPQPQQPGVPGDASGGNPNTNTRAELRDTLHKILLMTSADLPARVHRCVRRWRRWSNIAAGDLVCGVSEWVAPPPPLSTEAAPAPRAAEVPPAPLASEQQQRQPQPLASTCPPPQPPPPCPPGSGPLPLPPRPSPPLPEGESQPHPPQPTLPPVLLKARPHPPQLGQLGQQQQLEHPRQSLPHLVTLPAGSPPPLLIALQPMESLHPSALQVSWRESQPPPPPPPQQQQLLPVFLPTLQPLPSQQLPSAFMQPVPLASQQHFTPPLPPLHHHHQQPQLQPSFEQPPPLPPPLSPPAPGDGRTGGWTGEEGSGGCLQLGGESGSGGGLGRRRGLEMPGRGGEEQLQLQLQGEAVAACSPVGKESAGEGPGSRRGKDAVDPAPGKASDPGQAREQEPSPFARPQPQQPPSPPRQSPQTPMSLPSSCGEGVHVLPPPLPSRATSTAASPLREEGERPPSPLLSPVTEMEAEEEGEVEAEHLMTPPPLPPLATRQGETVTRLLRQDGEVAPPPPLATRTSLEALAGRHSLNVAAAGVSVDGRGGGSGGGAGCKDPDSALAGSHSTTRYCASEATDSAAVGAGAQAPSLAPSTASGAQAGDRGQLQRSRCSGEGSGAAATGARAAAATGGGGTGRKRGRSTSRGGERGERAVDKVGQTAVVAGQGGEKDRRSGPRPRSRSRSRSGRRAAAGSRSRSPGLRRQRTAAKSGSKARTDAEEPQSQQQHEEERRGRRGRSNSRERRRGRSGSRERRRGRSGSRERSPARREFDLDDWASKLRHVIEVDPNINYRELIQMNFRVPDEVVRARANNFREFMNCFPDLWRVSKKSGRLIPVDAPPGPPPPPPLKRDLPSYDRDGPDGRPPPYGRSPPFYGIGPRDLGPPPRLRPYDDGPPHMLYEFDEHYRPPPSMLPLRPMDPLFPGDDWDRGGRESPSRRWCRRG